MNNRMPSRLCFQVQRVITWLMEARCSRGFRAIENATWFSVECGAASADIGTDGIDRRILFHRGNHALMQRCNASGEISSAASPRKNQSGTAPEKKALGMMLKTRLSPRRWQPDISVVEG